MNIVHIVRGDFNPNSLNGVYKVIDSVSKALSSNNVNVCVLSISDKGKEDIYIPKEYNHIRVAESKFLFLITKEFKSFISNQPIDTIYHFHSVFIPWFLNFFYAKLRIIFFFCIFSVNFIVMLSAKFIVTLHFH